jgi:hypothetical protein
MKGRGILPGYRKMFSLIGMIVQSVYSINVTQNI